jgi:lipoate-protein ligase A
MTPRFEIAPPASAQENMDRDHRRLLELKEGETPLLSLYSWSQPSLTFGYFTDPEAWLNVPELAAAGFSLGKRPTGGGVIFHTHDLAFSVLIPKGHPKLSENTLQNYALINGMVKEAIASVTHLPAAFLPHSGGHSTFCMAEPTVFDVMVEGRKVGGAAQRRRKEGLLHQGSIALALPERELISRFIKDREIIDKIFTHTYPLNIPYDRLAQALKDAFLTLLAE